jgi:hypothetical protein
MLVCDKQCPIVLYYEVLLRAGTQYIDAVRYHWLQHYFPSKFLREALLPSQSHCSLRIQTRLPRAQTDRTLATLYCPPSLQTTDTTSISERLKTNNEPPLIAPSRHHVPSTRRHDRPGSSVPGRPQGVRVRAASPAVLAYRILTTISFFVNNLGHIRMIEAPEKQYVFHATNNERVNEMRREAMQGKDSCLSRSNFLISCRVLAPGDREASICTRHQPHLPPRIHNDQAQWTTRAYTSTRTRDPQDPQAHYCPHQ